MFIFILFTAGCTAQPAGEELFPVDEESVEGEIGAKMQRVKVVTTVFPLADIIRHIGGQGVEVTTLLAAGASPHTYEPTVEQAKAVAGADLVIFIGGGLDNWAVKLAEGAPQVRLLEIMERLEHLLLDYNLLHLAHADKDHHEHDHDHAHDHAHDHDHDHDHEDEGDGDHHHHHHGPHDPHFWLDPLLVKEVIAPLIAGELQSVNKQWESIFQENLARFQDELDELHEEIAAQVATFRQKRFISYHSAWNYFAHRYGLEEVAAVEEFPGKEPSARWMAELVKLAAQHDIKVLFAEPQLGGNTAAVIAREMGGEVLLLDPLGGEGIPGRDDYFALLRYNTKILSQALGSDSP